MKLMTWYTPNEISRFPWAKNEHSWGRIDAIILVETHNGEYLTEHIFNGEDEKHTFFLNAPLHAFKCETFNPEKYKRIAVVEFQEE